MAIATNLTSMASLSHTLQCNNNQRDASFSSFLNTEEETIIRKLAEDGDAIGVFDAEKYFESRINDDDRLKLATTVANVSGKHHQPKRGDHQSENPDRLVKPNSPLGSLSVRSESSYNSQTTLIRGPLMRTLYRKRTNKFQGKSLLAAFGCNFCSCSDKESVDVHDELKKPATDHDPVSIQSHKETTRHVLTKQPIRISLDLNKKIVQMEGSSWIKQEKQKILSCQDLDNLVIGQRKENCFAFPTLSSSLGNLPSKTRVWDDHRQNEPKFLKPLEAFGMINSFGLAGVSASSVGGCIDDDEKSDGSSDLFEIESISRKVTSGCLTPTACYAPSEASVDWSVATTRDFYVLSGHGHDQFRPWTSPTRASSGSGTTKLTCNNGPRELSLTRVELD